MFFLFKHELSEIGQVCGTGSGFTEHKTCLPVQTGFCEMVLVSLEIVSTWA